MSLQYRAHKLYREPGVTYRGASSLSSSVAASGDIGSVYLTPAEGSATGSAACDGSFAPISLTACAGDATGAATCSASLAHVTLTAPISSYTPIYFETINLVSTLRMTATLYSPLSS